jgi:hypothetical protein
VLGHIISSTATLQRCVQVGSQEGNHKVPVCNAFTISQRAALQLLQTKMSDAVLPDIAWSVLDSQLQLVWAVAMI